MISQTAVTCSRTSRCRSTARPVGCSSIVMGGMAWEAWREQQYTGHGPLKPTAQCVVGLFRSTPSC